MGLVAGGVDFGDGLGEEVAVDDGAEAGRRRRGFGAGGGEDGVGGELAEVGDGGGVESSFGEVSVFLLGLREGGDRGGREWKAPPLSPMALAMRSFDSGEAMRELTEKEPADSPKTVTLLGSPPKAAMLRWTQARAAAWSRRP